MALSLSQLEALSTDQLAEAFSDCYKSLHGVRPRGEYYFERARLIDFWLNYDKNFERVMQEEAEALAEQEAYEAEAWAALDAANQIEKELEEVGAYATLAYRSGVAPELLEGW